MGDRELEVIGEEINLTDLVDVEMLQMLHDSFSMLTGMASITTDRYGVPVTNGSRLTSSAYSILLIPSNTMGIPSNNS